MPAAGGFFQRNHFFNQICVENLRFKGFKGQNFAQRSSKVTETPFKGFKGLKVTLGPLMMGKR